MTIYEMSVETGEGPCFRPGFHLGTDERQARELIVERFAGRVAWELPVVTIALCDGPKVLDVYYGNGQWHSATYTEE